MRKNTLIAFAASAALLPTVACANANESSGSASAVLHDAKGAENGKINLVEGQNGVLAVLEVSGVTPGWHGAHIHETGDCSSADFKSAGGHAMGGHKNHGFLQGTEQHAGDMSNIWIGSDGTGKAQQLLYGVKLTELLDNDGAAVIIHAGADDYKSQPSGDAGGRIACGLIK